MPELYSIIDIWESEKARKKEICKAEGWDIGEFVWTLKGMMENHYYEVGEGQLSLQGYGRLIGRIKKVFEFNHLLETNAGECTIGNHAKIYVYSPSKPYSGKSEEDEAPINIKDDQILSELFGPKR